MSAIRVLLVEDESLIRMMIADFLQDQGFKVTEAQDGDEAVRLLDVYDFDVLFTDVRMPGTLDGIDVALWTRRQHPGLPLLIVSGYADQLSDRLSAFDPAAVFLSKPYRLNEAANAFKCLSLKQ